jgi:hypothetical protein
VKIKSQRDFASGLMFILIGAGFAIGALNYTFGSSAKPGPAFFPFGLGILMTVLGGLVLFKALTIECDDGEPIGHIAWRPLLVLVGAVVLFGLMLPKIGMAISLPVLVVASSLASDEFSWKTALASALLLTLMAWGVFVKGLGLTIPLWPAVAA